MSAPLIGITGGRQRGMLGVPAPVTDSLVYTYFADYSVAVSKAGGTPVLLPLDGPVDRVVDRLDGVLLTGGEDVDPRRYGSTPGPFQTPIDPLRDEYEIALVKAALDWGLPVLAICRGGQLLNIALGGTLIAHLPPDAGEGHSYRGYPRAHRAHRVGVMIGSTLESIVGSELFVNSYHHQAVAQLGTGLVAVAQAPDQVIEAIELSGRDVLGVQWHPEMFAEPDPLFDWLVDRAKNPPTRFV